MARRGFGRAGGLNRLRPSRLYAKATYHGIGRESNRCICRRESLAARPIGGVLSGGGWGGMLMASCWAGMLIHGRTSPLIPLRRGNRKGRLSGGLFCRQDAGATWHGPFCRQDAGVTWLGPSAGKMPALHGLALLPAGCRRYVAWLFCRQDAGVTWLGPSAGKMPAVRGVAPREGALAPQPSLK